MMTLWLSSTSVTLSCTVFTITQTHLQHLYGHLISLLQMMSCGTDAKNIWMAANHLSLVRNVGVAFTTMSKLEREVLFDAFVAVVLWPR